MVQPERSTMAYGQTRTAAEVDAGLRSYMLRVYNYMSLGVAFTGAVALIVAMNPAAVQTVASLFWVFFPLEGEEGGGRPLADVAHVEVLAVAILDPAVLGVDRLMAAFAGMSLVGYTTKKNLGPMGAFLSMATIGILIALLVNVFLVQSSMFHMGLSVVVVLVFAGLTAYETQQIKNWYASNDGHDVVTRKAIFGAFLLYGSFVTMFIWILNILGMLRGE